MERPVKEIQFGSHAGLPAKTALQPLQQSDLIALRRHEPFQIRHLGEQFHHQSSQLRTWQTRPIGGRRHVMSESYTREPGQTKMQRYPGVLPLLPLAVRPSAWRSRARTSIAPPPPSSIASTNWAREANGKSSPLHKPRR
jgi:hypothetical protein